MRKMIFACCALLLPLLQACKQGNAAEQEEADTNGYVARVETGGTLAGSEVKALRTVELVTNATLKNQTFNISVRRSADESLPVVTDDDGQRYYDNRVVLHVAAGGKTVFDKEFTKESFASFIADDNFMKHALLEGLAFEKTEGDKLLFSASVSYPESDLYVPLRIAIAANGSMAISQADLMDDLESVTDTE